MATQLTTQMAIGAAWLSSRGERVECFLELGDRKRFCFLETCEDDSGEAVNLSHRRGNEVLHAVVKTSRVRVSDLLSVRLLSAYTLSQETPAEREAREANEKLWRQYKASCAARRNPSGQFAGNHCEPAGRR